MAEDISTKIFNAITEIQGSNDPEVFVKKLLKDTLNWPIEIDELEEFDFDDLGYDWNSELEAMGLRSDEGIQDLFQIAKFPGWPLGMFVVRFGSNSIFTKGRGMTTPLRNLLRNLIEKVRPTASHQTWSQDQLLFMCHHEHTYYEFARFTDLGEKTLPKLQSFGWGPNDGDAIRTLCTENLPHLIYDQSINEEANLQNIAKAFDVQKVSRNFYSDYKQSFNAFKIELLKHAERDDNDEIHRYVQLVFNRFLFLRFIEKKGWLRFGPDGNYLRNLYDSFVGRGKKFYEKGFLPMALKGLVEPGQQNSEVYGQVELIGGGLFEPSVFDTEFSNIPNEMFSPIIGANGLLYRYNFTVQESTPLDVHVAIDPEMIGTMFEELVTNRDGKGAFYTPRVVVSYMCKEGLKSTLEDKTDVDKEKIRNLVDFEETESISIPDAKKIREALDEIKAIDPACGSGAYLLGLLQEIIRIHENLQTLSSEFKSGKYDLKLHVISRSIYGVDLDPFATQIAMLRLWLSLAVEADEPTQLPNLDFNIETGDALLATDPSQVDWFVGDLYDRADELGMKKDKYVHVKEGIVALRNEIKSEEEEITKLLRKNQLHTNSVDFRIKFASVFSKNQGFDLVLANPPYVRKEEIPQKVREYLAKQFPEGTSGWSDLYVYFFIRGFQLLRPKGHHLFICSNSWLDNGFGKKLQQYLLKFQIDWLLDSLNERQFSSAAVNTLITKITKKTSSPEHLVDFRIMTSDFESSIRDPKKIRTNELSIEELTKIGTDEKEVYQGERWNQYLRAPNFYWELLDEAADKLVPLSEVADIRLGITSGFNDFFYLKKSNTHGIENEFLVPLFKSARGFNKYQILKEDCDLVLFCCNLPKERILETKALQYINEAELKGINNRPFFKSKKRWYSITTKQPPPIIAPKTMSDIYRLFLNPDNVYVDKRSYEIRSKQGKDQILYSILSSTITSFMIEMSSQRLGDGLLDLNADWIGRILIPNPSLFDNLPVLSRDIKKLPEEIISTDRIELDKIVLSKLGLNEGHLEKVYDLLQEFVNEGVLKSKNYT